MPFDEEIMEALKGVMKREDRVLQPIPRGGFAERAVQNFRPSRNMTIQDDPMRRDEAFESRSDPEGPAADLMHIIPFAHKVMESQGMKELDANIDRILHGSQLEQESITPNEVIGGETKEYTSDEMGQFSAMLDALQRGGTTPITPETMTSTPRTTSPTTPATRRY